MIVLALAPFLAFAASTITQVDDPPTVRQKATGEFLTKHYPVGARRRGEHGRVAFSLEVDRDGKLVSCQVTGTSGFATLDSETCDFLIRYAKLKPARDTTGREASSVVQGYINWKLPPGSKRLAAADPSTALDPDKKICRSYLRTGSKVARVRQCMTRQEWALKDRNNQDEVRRMQDIGGSCGDGNPPPCS